MNWLRKLLGSGQPSAVALEGGMDEALDRMRDAGADLSQPRDTRHYLYFKTREQAEEAGERMRAAGYRVGVEPGALDDGTWLALASHDLVVSKEGLLDARAALVELCAGLEPDYDGWEAAV